MRASAAQSIVQSGRLNSLDFYNRLPSGNYESNVRKEEKSTLFYDRLGIVDSTKIDLEKLGHKIRFLRQGKGWTLSDLAAKTGLSKAYISDLENGSSGKPNIQYIFALAQALGTTLDELLHDTTAKPLARPKRSSDLPSGLAELQQELNLSDEDVERLATVNFRGHRPRDKEGWRFLLETLQMLSQRKLQK